MVNVIFRVFLLCVGIFVACDALLPVTTQTLKIVRHDIIAMRNYSKNYNIYFNNSRLKFCTVDKQQYSELNDGDELIIKSSRLLKSCVKIERNGLDVHNSGFWRLFNLLLSAGLIVYGVGWFKPEKWWS